MVNQERQSFPDTIRIRLLRILIAVGPIFAFRINDNTTFGVIDFLFIPLLVSTLIYRETRITNLELLYGVFLLISFMSQIFSMVAPNVGLFSISYHRLWASFLPFALVMGIRHVDQNLVSQLTSTFFISGLIAIVIGITLHHMGIELRTEQQRLWVGGGYGNTARAGGLLGNSGNFGHFAANWATIILFFSLANRNRFLKLFLITAIVLGCYSTFISSSRAAMLHLLVAFTFIVLIINVRTLFKIVLASLLIALLSLIYFPVFVELSGGASFTLRRLDIFNLSGDSLFFQTIRFSSWDSLYNQFFENPFLGLGYKNPTRVFGVYTDNAFMSTFLEFGLFAGICYLVWWLSALGAAVRQINASRLWATAGMAVILSEIAHGTTLDTHTIWYSMPIVMAFIALSIRMGSQAQRTLTHTDANT